MEVIELEQGDIADEAYLARQAHEEELFARMKHQEEDLKAQEQRKWEEETQQWQLRKNKREEEEEEEVCSFPENWRIRQAKGEDREIKHWHGKALHTEEPFPGGFLPDYTKAQRDSDCP